MATEGATPIRRAILTTLKTDAELLAILPAASIQPTVTPPPWPFVRYGAPSAVPIQASCVDGDEVTVAVHSFAKARENASGQKIETAEDYADRIGTTVLRALHRQRLALPSGSTARITRTGFQLLQDGAEADAYHHISQFKVRVIS